MFLFLRLLLAHFIADYPLQTNRLFCCKLRSLKGQFLHAGIHVIVFIFLLFPFLHHPHTWLLILFIGLSHLFLDITKVKLLDKTKASPVMLYCLDQICHVLAVGVVFLSPFANQVPDKIDSLFLSWYWNDALILFLIGLIFSTYFVTYLIVCFDLKKPLHPVRKYYSMLERGIIYILCLTGIFWAIPVVFLGRFGLYTWLKNPELKYTSKEIWLGLSLALITGLLIRIC